MRRVARKDGAPSITGCRRPSALANLADIVARIFVRDGVSRDNAIPLAGTVVAAERDGSLSHGLLRLPGYVATLKSGWVDGRAVPVVIASRQGAAAGHRGRRDLGFAPTRWRSPARVRDTNLLRGARRDMLSSTFRVPPQTDTPCRR